MADASDQRGEIAETHAVEGKEEKSENVETRYLATDSG
jgi:hypothetical protein